MIPNATYLTVQEATQRGMTALTDAYSPREYPMLNRVVEDMRRGKTKFALVAEDPAKPEYLSVYRK